MSSRRHGHPGLRSPAVRDPGDSAGLQVTSRIRSTLSLQEGQVGIQTRAGLIEGFRSVQYYQLFCGQGLGITVPRIRASSHNGCRHSDGASTFFPSGPVSATARGSRMDDGRWAREHGGKAYACDPVSTALRARTIDRARRGDSHGRPSLSLLFSLQLFGGDPLAPASRPAMIISAAA